MKHTATLISASLICLASLLPGCATSATTCTHKDGWHTKDKHEMRMLIGNTVMDALDQYIDGLSQKPPPVKKKPLA